MHQICTAIASAVFATFKMSVHHS